MIGSHYAKHQWCNWIMYGEALSVACGKQHWQTISVLILSFCIRRNNICNKQSQCGKAFASMECHNDNYMNLVHGPLGTSFEHSFVIKFVLIEHIHNDRCYLQ
jgi:hypothetical protein